jgi:anti-anti-sigma regulatory factor
VSFTVGAPSPGDAGVVVIRLSGDLEDVRPPELFVAVERARAAGEAGMIVLECSELRSVTLEGVAALISLWDAARFGGMRLVVRGADGRALEKLRQVGILGVLTENPPS